MLRASPKRGYRSKTAIPRKHSTLATGFLFVVMPVLPGTKVGFFALRKRRKARLVDRGLKAKGK
jgi:hypothetical protein